MSQTRQDLSENPGEYYAIVPLDNICIVRNFAYKFRFWGELFYNDAAFSYIPAQKVIEVNPNHRALKRFDGDWGMGRYVAFLALAVTENGRRRFGGKRVADAMNRLVEADKSAIAGNRIHLELASKTAIEALINVDKSVSEAQRQEILSLLEKFYKAPQEPAREDPSLEQSQKRGKLLCTKEILEKCRISRSTLNNRVKNGALKRAYCKGSKNANGYWQVDVEAIWGPREWS